MKKHWRRNKLEKRIPTVTLDQSQFDLEAPLMKFPRTLPGVRSQVV